MQTEQPKEVIKFHYAPMTGGIMKYINGQAQEIKDWSKHREIKDEFLKLQHENKLQLEETINYGHLMFHGHSGKVDIYTTIESK